jgi:hypothetical protein
VTADGYVFDSFDLGIELKTTGCGDKDKDSRLELGQPKRQSKVVNVKVGKAWHD